ncbi:disks large homolog 5-like isoform X1 [Schistocerca cancellata]|uniref:disks large homolog 5-like isoform X1 n=2 Tax=Schistocerca cancellata TaxID=274614 RepID=UPI002117C1BE|nr:disks large homolog 5-like isoform X1 [Schistocerca cancellata]
MFSVGANLDITAASVCNPQIRPIIEEMMMRIRPEEEVKMIRRRVALSEMKKKSESDEKNSKEEERLALLREYRALKMEVQEKKAKELAQKERIESLKREIKEKHQKASSLLHEIRELNNLTLTVKAASQQLENGMKLMCDSNCIASYSKNAKQEQQSSPSETPSVVEKFIAEQEVVIAKLAESRISAPPEPTPDVGLYAELIEAEVHNVALEKQLKENESNIELATDSLVQNTMHALSDSADIEVVREWAKLQVTRQTSDIVCRSLKEIISAGSSLRCDRDFLRVVLLDAEKKLNALDERYKSAQKELMNLASDLSHSWHNIEKAAEKARRKRSQVDIECKEAPNHLTELMNQLRRASAEELKALHETMVSLMNRDSTLQETLDFGTAYNDLFYILDLVAQKRMARHVTLSLPEMSILADDPRLEHLIGMHSDETRESESSNKFSNTCEWNQHMDALLSNNDQLVQSLRDLIAVWWQQPFETGVPEDMVVNGKNILQHTAHWDRVTAFVERKQMKE